MVVNKIIHKSLTINANIAKVWEHITKFSLIEQWWSDFDLQIATTWKISDPIKFMGIWHGRPYQDIGIVLDFEKEKLLRFTYLSHFSNLPNKIENHTVIEFKLILRNQQTVLELTQKSFPTEAIYAHWNFYWPVTLDCLKKLIER